MVVLSFQGKNVPAMIFPCLLAIDDLAIEFHLMAHLNEGKG